MILAMGTLWLVGGSNNTFSARDICGAPRPATCPRGSLCVIDLHDLIFRR